MANGKDLKKPLPSLGKAEGISSNKSRKLNDFYHPEGTIAKAIQDEKDLKAGKAEYLLKRNALREQQIKAKSLQKGK